MVLFVIRYSSLLYYVLKSANGLEGYGSIASISRATSVSARPAVPCALKLNAVAS